MSSIKVVKIGGNVVDNPEALERFLDDFVKLGQEDTCAWRR